MSNCTSSAGLRWIRAAGGAELGEDSSAQLEPAGVRGGGRGEGGPGGGVPRSGLLCRHPRLRCSRRRRIGEPRQI
jgi:hypothetical protein